MARKKTAKTPAKGRSKRGAKAAPGPGPVRRLWRGAWRWLRRGLLAVVVFFAALICLFAIVDPPTNLYIASERARLGEVDHAWVDWDDIAPVMARSVVAAEDANYCLHWGFDMNAIRQVIEAGESRGASTLTQQTVKNVFLWPARSWPRKALEALITPAVELVWSKRRILEVYMNVAEFGEGIFGVDAAAHHYFGVTPGALTPLQAARLAAVLPSPKTRSASAPGPFTERRAASIVDGAATIRADGRAACFEDG